MKPHQLLFLCLTVACSGRSGVSPRAPVSTQGEGGEPEFDVPRTIVTPEDARSVPELMREAEQLARQERFREAGAAYARVVRLDPDGEQSDEAAFAAGDSYDRANELELALAHYELVGSRVTGTPTPRARDARVRSARILVFLGRFERAGVIADKLLPKADELLPTERIAVLSAKALSLLERGDDVRASYFIEKGRDVIETHGLDAAGRVPRDLAQLYYALGESRRLRAERTSFEPMPPNFGAVLEARCQLLLDAQSAYSDSMRAYDAHWSAMAGYRVAELYQRLHEDLLAVKVPPSADTERKRQLFEGAVRLRYSVLLTKARGMAQHTLAMADRTGEKSEWVDRTRAALAVIESRIAEEGTALARLPYTRADFEGYFAQMEAQAGQGSSPTPTRTPSQGP